MKLSEYLKDFNLFQDLASNYPDLPIKNALTADFMLETGYGEREVFGALDNAPHTTVLAVINDKFSERWASLVQRQVQLQNVNTRRELKETTNRQEDTTNTETDVAQVSAFDSPELVDNSGNTRNGSGGVTGETTRVLIDEKIDPKSALSLLNIPVQDTILSTVVSDVSSFLTLTVY